MKPYITVIMPSLNVAPYIRECMESVLAQTMSNIEILCIDAGSTDGTWEILLEYARRDRRISVIHSDRKSYGYQVNLGIKLAKGDYIGVVETDDFIVPEMYEKLYQIAVQTKAEVIKADYDSFCLLPNGNRQYVTECLFADEASYDKVIDPRNIVYLYMYDFNIWKGIYSKNFLKSNHICLNESSGAAYQDIGFLMQVMSCTRKVYYSKYSLYRYRLDREESSVNSLAGLKYCYQEFQRLVETKSLREKSGDLPGIYSRMLVAFIGEYKKILRMASYNIHSDKIEPYRKWFSSQIVPLLSDNDFWCDDNIAYKSMVVEMLQDYYPQKLQEEDQKREEEQERLLRFIENKQVIIFGAGVRGKHMVAFGQYHGANIVGLCDNNGELWSGTKYGYKVMEPEQCRKQYPKAVYVIANKLYACEIKEQLICMGIMEKDIFPLTDGVI